SRFVKWITGLPKLDEMSLDPQCCDRADTLIVWRADDHHPIGTEKSQEVTGDGAGIFQTLDDFRTHDEIEASIRCSKGFVQIGVDPKHFRGYVEWLGKNIRGRY